MRPLLEICGCATLTLVSTVGQAAQVSTALAEMIDRHAKIHALPQTLVYRVIERESRFNSALHHGPNWGLMQIRADTARSMGFSGPARDLLDPETNLTFAVAYLANAYRVAGGNQERAIALYAHGYYFEAKRKGLLSLMAPAKLKTEP
jgi:soluble lytic murein transglycosylase-like protein